MEARDDRGCFGATLVGRIIAHVNDPQRMRVAKNPRDGYCCALVNLGPRFNRLNDAAGRLIFCSSRSRDGLFCGRHDHIYTLLGAEDIRDYVRRHGGRLTLAENGDFVTYESPRLFRRTPKVEPFSDSAPVV